MSDDAIKEIWRQLALPFMSLARRFINLAERLVKRLGVGSQKRNFLS